MMIDRLVTATQCVRILAFALVLFAASAWAATGEVKIGVTSAVNPEALGYPPLSPERELVLGQNVVGNERVVTTQEGQAHMLFLDGSALTVGPNSEIVLDTFIYDTTSKTGTLAFNVTKGLFRLVGGKISKTNPIIIKTPRASIGIRGGIAIIEVNPAADTNADTPEISATLLFGESLYVETPEGRSETTRPGYTIEVPLGGAPLQPVPADPQALDAALNGLEGRDADTDEGDEEDDTGQQVAAAESGDDDDDGAAADEGGESAEESDEGGEGDGESRSVEDVSDEDMADSKLTELGSTEDPGAIDSPDADAGGAAADATTGGEGDDSVRVSEASQDTTTEDIVAKAPSGSGLSGRLKSGTLPDGSNDLDPASNVGFDDSGLRKGGIAVLLEDNILVLPTGINVGDFGIDFIDPALAVNLSNDPLNGFGIRDPEGSFFYYWLWERDNPANRSIIFFGKPATIVPTEGFFTFDFTDFDFLLGSAVPFVPGDVLFSDELEGDPLFLTSIFDHIEDEHMRGNIEDGHIRGKWIIAWDDSRDGRAGAFGGSSVYISGTGADQVSSITTLVGDVLLDDQGRLFITGVHRGSARDGQDTPHVLFGDIASTDDGSGNDFFGAAGEPEIFSIESGRVDGNDQTDSGYLGSTDRGFTEADRNFFGNNLFIRSEATGPFEVSRGARTLNGFVGGLRMTVDSVGTIDDANLLGNEMNLVTDVVIQTDPDTNTISASFAYNDSFGTQQFAVLLRFGDSASTTGRSVFGHDTAFGARESEDGALIEGASADGESYMGSMSTRNLPEDFLIASGFRLDDAPEYEFMSWGFWGTRLDKADDTNEVVHMAVWVAGELPDPGIDLTGQGTAVIYRGHAIGTVLEDGGISYIAMGGYDQTFNFQTGEGTALFTQFNGHDFAILVSISPIPGEAGFFMGSLDDGTTQFGLTGAFFASPTDPVAGVGGNFNYTMPGEQASGIFVGER